MFNTRTWLALGLLSAFALPALGQSFRVQCPTSTITHPSALHDNNSEPAYAAATYTGTNGYVSSGAGNVNGAIKCQQISGGDGYSTMGDGTQTYMFSFGPLSGVNDIANGLPGTEFPSVFNTPYPATGAASALPPGYPAVLPATAAAANYNGAIGQVNDVSYTYTIYDISEVGNTVTVVLNSQSPFKVGDQVLIGPPTATDLAGYLGTFTVTHVNVANPFFAPNFAFQYTDPTGGLAEVTSSPSGAASSPPGITGHVDARQIMDVGVMNGNIPAPLMAIDEDDEFFLTLTNVGMIMRPDLFEQHTVHFHGYPNASSFYDGVPDASVAINIAASFTYYYLAPDAGTYFWHCHITPPEHLQMGMVGQIYVRPRQNRWSGDLYTGLTTQQGDLRTACNSTTDILCSNPVPAVNTAASNNGTKKYAYNDGDGSTYYDVELPLQMHGFDPNFHFVGMTFNPEGFADMKDKYFLLNGRSYPDTVTAGPLQTQSADGVNHFSQPLPAVVTMTAGQRALLRISELNVSEYHTLASLGIPMTVIGYNAKLLRDQAGNNLYYTTNSITLGGGESLDVILDSCLVRSTPADPSSACTTAIAPGTYYLYTPNLDHLSNDAENFGGQMTEVRLTP
ncbi:MAG TPA: multicopper oxidase domain-containing protein [Steroidobacteraceae bacterium]|nr:multicopper oxidase domain-containing protein [Steroidobacteraceae bacterium]